MSIEKKFDIPFIANLALREKQIQQNYRPIIAVHKWFARRPGTLFRGLILAEFSDRALREAFYGSNDLQGIAIADPFMGGGTPLIEANRLGCAVSGFDINPMAYWIVSREIEHLDLERYRNAAEDLIRRVEAQIGVHYRTRCLECGAEVPVKYFLWVKTQNCRHCDGKVDLFPGYLLAENRRHPENVLICPTCGELNGVEERTHPGACRCCGNPLALAGPAKRNRCECPHCGRINVYPSGEGGPPGHRMFAIEYHCRHCKPTHQGRFFKKPDEADLARFDRASRLLKQTGTMHVPEDRIPPGDETDRLIRWGYRQYREMFNDRQLLGLELSCRLIADLQEERIRNALITNLSDLLRYQNMLCRYDAMALKSLDIFSVHGFPVGLIQCESNFLGIANGGGTSIGSGGWSNILEKYVKAKAYCNHPFETCHEGQKKILVPTLDEWIGDRKNGDLGAEPRMVHLYCASATQSDLPIHSLDGVFTDPPYFGNVQYAELMDFCYVWVRKLVGNADPIFRQASTRNAEELTGNITMERGLDHFTQGLSAVFQNMAKALKPGKPLAFTYHHNRLEAYHPVVVAILDAGLTCSASIPCPAEMGASIHINGTASSIVDTVFVCRSTGTIPRRWLAESPEQIAALVLDDLGRLTEGGLKPTRGDIRCILYGHLVRLVIWRLRLRWDRSQPTSGKLAVVASELKHGRGPGCVEAQLAETYLKAPRFQHHDYIQERSLAYGGLDDEISF